MAKKRNLQQWAILFKALGSPYRLRILQLLERQEEMTVTMLTTKLNISLKNTSRNLSILQNLGLVESMGKQGHVPYRLSRRLPTEAIKVLRSSIWN